jgi:hypothetical protein
MAKFPPFRIPSHASFPRLPLTLNQDPLPSLVSRSAPPSHSSTLGGRSIPNFISKAASPRGSSAHVVKIRSDSCLSTAAGAAVSQDGSADSRDVSATGEVSSAFGVAGCESPPPLPLTRLRSQRKSVSFIVPEILFSEEDYAAATALQEADEGRTDDEHDDTRALAGMLTPPFPIQNYCFCNAYLLAMS